MSRIAGRLALHNALKHYKGDKLPRLTVIGAGAAGISTALEAVKHHIPVQLFGRKESLRSEFESKGITYYVLPEAEKQVNFIKSFLTKETLVITAARIPEKRPHCYWMKVVYAACLHMQLLLTCNQQWM